MNAVVLMSEGQAIAVQYPEPAPPAAQPAIMAVVVTAVLAMWLILVFLVAGNRAAKPEPWTENTAARKLPRP